MAKLQPYRLSCFLLILSLSLCSQAHGNQLTASDAAGLYAAETTYSIFRKGKNIGRHSLKFDTQNNRINVAVDSKITITVLKLPVFKFQYFSTETWDDNRLVRSKSTTNTDGHVETASLQNRGDSSMIANNNGEQTTARIDYATNHWHISAVEQSRLFNTVKGVTSDIIVTKIGKETLNISGQQIETTRYAYSGDLIAESWYDQNKRWVKLAFLGSDGNEITYLIDKPINDKSTIR